MPVTYGISGAGFIKKTLAVIRQELVNAASAKFGDSINCQPETPLGQIIDITAERLSLLWEEAEAIYNQQNPLSAEDVNLDRACSLVGITRLPELKSTVTATCTGTIATVIPAGTQFQVAGDTTNIFQTLADGTIGGGGTVNIACEALVAGAKVCNTGSLTVIVNPVAGLTSVTNASDAVIGNATESDADLRTRRELSLTISDAGTLEAIRAQLLTLDGVTQVAGFENDTDAIVGIRTPHSIEMVVRGGDSQEIADALWLCKPAGIGTSGTVSKTVVDTEGTARTVKFSTQSDIRIYVAVTVTQVVGSVVVAQDVKDALLAYFDTLNMGDDVLPLAELIPAVTDNVANIYDILLYAKTSAPANVSVPIAIAANELATLADGDITVTII